MFRSTFCGKVVENLFEIVEKVDTAPEDLPNKLLATGYDIETGKVTLIADKTVFKSNSGATIAVFNSEGTKITATAIELTGSDSISLKINNDTASAKSEAISTASSDATTKANNARTQAVNTAATDATTKANNAQSAAISAAATDATTKSDNAKNAAISAAATDASSKANAAQIAAINDITSKLSGTGINMQDKLLTLYSGASGGTGQGKVVILGDNFSVDAAGKIKAVDGEFTGKITAVEGSFGAWTIDGNGIKTQTHSGSGSLSVELTGGYFLRINETANTMMSIRADSRRAISIYTQGLTGVGIDLTGQTGSTAISSFGSHKFVQRNGEEWNAPGVIAAGWFHFENEVLSGFSYWKISPIALYAERMSNNEVRISHTLNHADYIPLVWREQGQAFLYSTPTSTEFRIDGIGQGTRGGRICFLMIGRNRS